MMKKIALIAAALMLAVSALAFAACGKEEKDGTLYRISAALDADNMIVTASMDVHYFNSGESGLDDLQFMLYPSAYREGARYAAVSESEQGEAYPHGMSYGGVTISEVTVGGESCEWAVGGEDEDVLIVSVPEIAPGGYADVSVKFTLALPETRNRFGHMDGVVNLGNWYPIVAMRDESGWRTDPYYSYGDPFYSSVADYEVTFTVPEGWEVAGTGSVSASLGDGNATYSFTASGVRDFAMSASANYVCAERETNGVKVRYYSSSEDTEGLDTACRAVETFSRLFGEYPYDTLSVAITPFKEGGMEYPSFVMVSDALGGDMKTEAIVHEISHQWWYAAVGNDQINEPWLDEGLAEYSTTLYYENNPDLGVTTQDRIADAMQSYILFSDVYSDTEGIGRMDRPLGSYSSPTDYAFHAYVKGELMFDSLRHIIGDEAFFNGLKSYYSDYSGRVADAGCLIAEFEKSSGLGLVGFFESWLSGTASVM